jgi:hypothetical protein
MMGKHDLIVTELLPDCVIAKSLEPAMEQDFSDVHHASDHWLLGPP